MDVPTYSIKKSSVTLGKLREKVRKKPTLNQHRSQLDIVIHCGQTITIHLCECSRIYVTPSHFALKLYLATYIVQTHKVIKI